MIEFSLSFLTFERGRKLSDIIKIVVIINITHPNGALFYTVITQVLIRQISQLNF